MSRVMPTGLAGTDKHAAQTATSAQRHHAVLLAIDRVTTGAAVASACAMLCIAVACGLWQVTVRFLFNAPSEWSEVLTRFALIWMVYLGAAAAVRQGSMVSIDLMHRLSKGRVRWALEGFIVLATIALMGVLLWFGAQLTWRVRFQQVAGLSVAMSWAYLAIPVGAALSIVSVLAHFVDPQRHELDTAV
jgi:TRAP-type C4-dicarboxylate transport system permease small subunit